MAPIIGTCDTNVAPVDAAVAGIAPRTKVLNLRTYATFDNPAPAYWTTIAPDRTLFSSEKFKFHNAITAATDDTAGKFDAQIVAYITNLIALGHEKACFQHEADAATAAAGGSVAQVEAAILHANKIARGVPGWNGEIYVCVTGWNILQRGPLYAAIFADADGIMFDAPYSDDGKQSGDSIAGPVVDWFNKNWPGKPLVIGEWGCVNTAPNQAAWIAQFIADLQKPRYANVRQALYWNNAAYTVSGAALTALAQGIADSQVPPTKAMAIADLVALKAAAAMQSGAYGDLHDAYVSFEQTNVTLLGLLAKADA